MLQSVEEILGNKGLLWNCNLNLPFSAAIAKLAQQINNGTKNPIKNFILIQLNGFNVTYLMRFILN